MLIAAVAVGAFAAAGGEADSSRSPMTTRALERVENRLFSKAIRREGIFVVEGGVEGTGATRCYRVSLLNPTKPNRAYLRGLFGRALCSKIGASGFAEAGTGCGAPPGSGLPVTVPDVRGLVPYVAARRIEAAGLRPCNAAGRPGRYEPENALRVVTQCPAAGTRVSVPGFVFTQSSGRLPGGFEISASQADGRCPG